MNHEDKEALMISILNHINDDHLRTVGANDNSIWQKGWAEVFAKIESLEKINIADLAPQYFEKHHILRFNGQYIKTDSIPRAIEPDRRPIPQRIGHCCRRGAGSCRSHAGRRVG